MQIIVDLDPVVYRAGFAGESHSYECVLEHPDGSLHQQCFSKTKKSSAGDLMKAYIKAHDATVIDKHMMVHAEPLAFVLRGAKLTLAACIRDVILHTGYLGDPVIVPLLTGAGNFRERIATIKPYKGNRDKVAKPVHYQAIRDYLVEHQNARIVEGYEADDECSILATQAAQQGQDFVVCSIDKDLDQIPGKHYDYAKKQFYKVYEDEGQYMFWKQTLCGDSTDNIQGMYRIGDKAATKLLDSWIEDKGWNAQEIWNLTVEAYSTNMKKYPEKFPEGITPVKAALENARLVFMQKYRGQLWTAPNLPDEVL